LTAGRRLLLVLDDVHDTSQVAPLLPGGPGCGVLITSRRVLAGLDGASGLQLKVLAPQEAVALLGRLIGEERIAVDPAAADELARRCGWLPLALRIAGARLAARPGWPVRVLAERLADARRRLDELELPDIGVRASFRISWTELSDSPDQEDRDAAAAFALLGILDGPEVGLPVAARLLDRPEPETDRVLERLVDAQLLETSSPGRYHMHDLLGVYAREQAARQYTPQQQAAGLRRVLGMYVATCWRTLDLLCPGDPRLGRADGRFRKGGLDFADELAALGWLEAERANLLAAVEQVATTPGVPSEFAVQLAQALFGFFRVRGYWSDWARVNQTALAVASRMGDRSAQAQAHNDLGLAHSRQGQYERALDCHQQSLTIYQELGDRRGQAASLNNLGIVHQRQGRYDQALACHQQSLAIRRELGDPYGQAESLRDLGVALQALGHHQEKLARWREALAIFEQLQCADAEAIRSLLTGSN
jgi:tetratricopeptide (TPR) repeat protein